MIFFVAERPTKKRHLLLSQGKGQSLIFCFPAAQRKAKDEYLSELCASAVNPDKLYRKDKDLDILYRFYIILKLRSKCCGVEQSGSSSGS